MRRSMSPRTAGAARKTVPTKKARERDHAALARGPLRRSEQTLKTRANRPNAVGPDRREIHPMNETQTHFVASCPYCSTQLRIRRVFAGQQVQCKHCNETFVAKETDGPATSASGEIDPVRPLPPLSQPERVVVSCPSCQAALSIRRVYLGRQVRCKQCDETFVASDSAASMALSQEARRDRNGKDTEHAALQAEVDRQKTGGQPGPGRTRSDDDRAGSHPRPTGRDRAGGGPSAVRGTGLVDRRDRSAPGRDPGLPRRAIGAGSHGRRARPTAGGGADRRSCRSRPARGVARAG